MRSHGPVTLIELADLGDDDLVVPAAMMGAPTVMVEKLPRGDEIVQPEPGPFGSYAAFFERRFLPGKRAFPSE